MRLILLILFYLILCTSCKASNFTIVTEIFGNSVCAPAFTPTSPPASYNYYYEFPLQNNAMEAFTQQTATLYSGSFNTCSLWGTNCLKLNNGFMILPYGGIQSSYSILFWTQLTTINTNYPNTLITTNNIDTINGMNTAIFYEAPGIYIIQFYQGSNDLFAIKANINVTNINSFVHIAFTFNGNNLEANIYINGKQLINGTFVSGWKATTSLQFGFQTSQINAYHGNIACLIVYTNTSLIDTDIQAIYNTELTNQQCVLSPWFPFSNFKYVLPGYSAYQSQILTYGSNLVLFWILNDVFSPTLTTIIDSSGNNNRGNIAGTINDYYFQQSDIVKNNKGCIFFTAANSNLYVAQQNTQVSPAVFTIEIWFNSISTTGGILAAFVLANNHDASYNLALTPTGQIIFEGQAAGILYVLSSILIGYNDGNKHQVVLSYNSKVSSGQAILYINGQQIASTSNAYPIGEGQQGNWYVGGSTGVYNNPPINPSLEAYLSDFSIYNIILSSVQVLSNYQLGA